MPYQIDDFKKLGLYDEKPAPEECELTGGKVITYADKVSAKIREMLQIPGGTANGGDFSRQDSAVITAFLAAGYSPEDTYETFIHSRRGRDAERRKPGHLEDYVRRTIYKSMGFLKPPGTNGSKGLVSVDFAQETLTSENSGLNIIKASDVLVQKVRWVWKNYIPAGTITILAGDPGMGKSTIVLDLVSRISRGRTMPDGEREITGISIVLSAEDSPGHTLLPRLIAAGADTNKILIMKDTRDDDSDQPRPITFPRDLDLIESKVIDSGARIMIIDPIIAFYEKSTDSHKDQDVRAVLYRLNLLAEKTGIAIVIVAHLNKNEEGSVIYRIGGSIGLTAAARSVLAVSRMSDGARVLHGIKVNLSRNPASLAYDLIPFDKKKTNGEWKGDDVTSSKIRWMGVVAFDPYSKNPQASRGDDERVVGFIRQILEDAGEVRSASILKEARELGISRQQVTAVASNMKVKFVKRGDDWFWQWPESK